jgi:uncharacterized protein (TIGR02001 family)
MKKVILSAAVLAVCAAPAFAADLGAKMATKAPPPAPAPVVSPWDVGFGTALTSDYILRGISQSNRHPAIQGFVEPSYKFSDMFQLYGGVWASSLYSGFADAEFDIYGGGRFSWQQFGLDVGYVQYEYPGGGPINYGEVYVKPSYKFNDWLSVAGQVYWGDNFGNTGYDATYYTGNVTVTLPQFLPYGIGASISGDLGTQNYASAVGFPDYTVWDVGMDFTYKAATLDLRYYDTDLAFTDPQCASIPTSGSVRNICNGTFVATLSFATSLSALK